jgi:hypothetical protein
MKPPDCRDIVQSCCPHIRPHKALNHVDQSLWLIRQSITPRPVTWFVDYSIKENLQNLKRILSYAPWLSMLEESVSQGFATRGCIALVLDTSPNWSIIRLLQQYHGMPDSESIILQHLQIVKKRCIYQEVRRKYELNMPKVFSRLYSKRTISCKNMILYF